MKQHSLLASLSLVHLVGDGFAAALNPLLPFIAADFALSYAKAGSIKSCYEFLYSTLQLPSALLAERIGATLLLATAMTWLSIGFLLIGLAVNFGHVLFWGLLAGAGGSAYHPVGTSTVSGVYLPPRRGSAIGVFNSAGDVGKALLAFAAAYMAGRHGWRPAFFLLASCGIATSVLLLRLQRALSRGKPTLDRISKSESRGWGIHDKKGLALLTSIGVLDSLSRSAALTFLSFLLVTKAIAPEASGVFFAIVYVSGALGKLGCGPLADRWGNLRLVMATETATGVLAWLLIPAAGGFLIPLLIALGFVLTGTSSALYSAVAQFISPERLARGYGIYYSVTLMAGAIAPLLLGFVADKFNLQAVFFAVGLLAISAVPLAAFLIRRKGGSENDLPTGNRKPAPGE